MTASADTREGPVKDLFSNFLDKSPDSLLRRIDGVVNLRYGVDYDIDTCRAGGKLGTTYSFPSGPVFT